MRTRKTFEAIVALLIITLLNIAAPTQALAQPTTSQGSERAYSSESAWVYVPAVTDHKGELVNLSITLTWPGNGTVSVTSNGIVAPSTSYSLATAIWTAALLRGIDPLSINAKVEIHAAGEISGPSASIAAAILTFTMLIPTFNLSILHNYVITGAIVPQGFSGPIGGANIKCRAAVNKNLFFILPLANYNKLSRECKENKRVMPLATILDTLRLTGGNMQYINITISKFNINANISKIFIKYTNIMVNKTRNIIYTTLKIIKNKKINISSTVKNKIILLINNSNKLINNSINIEENAPYSSASLAFTALAESLGAYYTLYLALNKNNIEKIVYNISKSLIRFKDEIYNLSKHSRCLERMELLSVAAARISDAEYNLEEFKALYRMRAAQLIDLGYTLGLAEARLYSIENWIEAARHSPCSLVLPHNFDRVIGVIVKYSALNGNYTVSVLEEMGLNTSASLISEMVNRMMKAWEENDTLLALGYAREILSLSTNALFSSIISIENLSSSEILEYYKSGVALYTYTLALLELNGLKSLLAPLYYEYARLLASLGDYNSSLNILASAIAANEVLLPIIARAPSPSAAMSNASHGPGPGGVVTRPSPEEGGGRASPLATTIVVATVLIIGFSIGFSIALHYAVRRVLPYRAHQL
ncbi:MAG: hypothetical protein LRS46_00365 [Desulfurococcales archaeon]|nr:hypothetical protein [Desulfurococcales archaeon]